MFTGILTRWANLSCSKCLWKRVNLLRLQRTNLNASALWKISPWVDFQKEHFYPQKGHQAEPFPKPRLESNSNQTNERLAPLGIMGPNWRPPENPQYVSAVRVRCVSELTSIYLFILLKGLSRQGGGGAPPLLFPNSEKKQNSFKLLNHTNSR